MTLNAMHMSMLPVCLEMILRRLVDYGPLLIASVVISYTQTPVLKVRSVQEFCHGIVVTDKDDNEALKTYLLHMVENGGFTHDGTKGFYDPKANIVPYICSIIRMSKGKDPKAQNHGLRYKVSLPPPNQTLCVNLSL